MESTHIFVCLRLLKTEWLKQLHKAADCLFDVPPVFGPWSKDMFEPLKIGVIFPFIDRKPWQLRSTPKMLEVGRKVRKVFEKEPLDAGDFLRQFLLEFKRLRSMPKDVVWRLLYFGKRSRVPHCSDRGHGRRKRARVQS